MDYLVLFCLVPGSNKSGKGAIREWEGSEKGARRKWEGSNKEAEREQ